MTHHARTSRVCVCGMHAHTATASHTVSVHAASEGGVGMVPGVMAVWVSVVAAIAAIRSGMVMVAVVIQVDIGPRVPGRR